MFHELDNVWGIFSFKPTPLDCIKLFYRGHFSSSGLRRIRAPSHHSPKVLSKFWQLRRKIFRFGHKFCKILRTKVPQNGVNLRLKCAAAASATADIGFWLTCGRASSPGRIPVSALPSRGINLFVRYQQQAAAKESSLEGVRCGRENARGTNSTNNKRNIQTAAPLSSDVDRRPLRWIVWASWNWRSSVEWTVY